jgi:hypothetical protein
MKKTILGILFLGLASMSLACEPCSRAEMITFDQAVEKADLIIVANRHNPPFFNDNLGDDGPSRIKVEVEKVLKGSLKERVIEVPSWSGMCAYGFVLYKERAVLMIKRKEGRFLTVNRHCGQHQFVLKEDKLTIKSMRGLKQVQKPFLDLYELQKKIDGLKGK